MSAEKAITTLLNYPENFYKNFNSGLKFEVAPRSGIIVIGMGGSAIAGNYVKSLFESTTGMPMVIYRGYTPPTYIDDSWQIIAISYSGNTEETLTSTQYYLEQGRKPLLISSGGKFAELAAKYNLQLIPVEQKLQPRDAFYHIFGILSAVCLGSKLKETVENILPLLKENRYYLKSDEFQGLLEKNSKRILGSQINIITPQILEAVGVRFRSQLNENSKLHSAAFSAPEFSHNAIVGYDGNYNKNITVILLQSDLAHSREQIHIKYYATLLPNQTIIYKNEGTLLSQMLNITAQADYLTIYLAQTQNIEVASVPSISKLKTTLKQDL